MTGNVDWLCVFKNLIWFGKLKGGVIYLGFLVLAELPPRWMEGATCQRISGTLQKHEPCVVLLWRVYKLWERGFGGCCVVTAYRLLHSSDLPSVSLAEFEDYISSGNLVPVDAVVYPIPPSFQYLLLEPYWYVWAAARLSINTSWACIPALFGRTSQHFQSQLHDVHADYCKFNLTLPWTAPC